MEDFKKIVKMKTGGSVSKAAAAFTKRDRKEVDSTDIAQDKKIVKKAIAIHDKQEHPGEKTDLSGLKKGGRSKKAVGTVKKYCGGKSVKKMADGGITGAIGDIATRLRNNVMGTPEQNAAAQARMDARKKALAAAALQGASAGGLGQAAQSSDVAQSMPAPAPQGIPAQKRGGKVKGKC